MKTIEEVGKVCESFGMERYADSGHPAAWLSPTYELGVTAEMEGTSMVAIHVQRSPLLLEVMYMAEIRPRAQESEALLSAVLSVLLKEGSDE